jgi:hypothetical protein
MKRLKVGFMVVHGSLTTTSTNLTAASHFCCHGNNYGKAYNMLNSGNWE